MRVYAVAKFISLYSMLFSAREEEPFANADQFRLHAWEKYVLPARKRKQKRFSTNAGKVVRELRLAGRAPAVCCALKTRRFLERNDLRPVGASGPKSGQSTAVTYTCCGTSWRK